ncbi:MAG: right-handed parallel beta-helix repeat-containing protein [Bacteroidales bacterium]|nr:right-handed parallel beta-helix repeat-containing protein [Bacteroidales bacterium]
MFKKIVFIAALAALAIGCTKETELTLSSESGTIEYKAGSYTLDVTSSEDWTLTPGGTYDWITPSKTSGKMGDQITFNAQVNLTGKIRSASYTITSGSKTKTISINQKSGTIDAAVSLSLKNVGKGTAYFDYTISTSNPDDYKDYGFYYGTTSDISKAQRAAAGSSVATGTKEVALEGLADNTEYYAWPWITTVTGVEVVGDTPVKVVPPICVAKAEDVQTTIDGAAEHSVIRLLGGMTVTGGLEMKDNITVSGGWNSDFTAQDAARTIIEGGEDIPGVLVLEGTKGAVIQNLEITKARCMNSPYKRGAGVCVNGDLTIENCYIHDNRAFSRGGGIGSDDSISTPFTLTVINSEISHNIAEDSHGAGIYSIAYSTIIMVNCLVAQNWCQEEGGYVGGAGFYGSSVLINNTFAKNYCNGEGDGYYYNYIFRCDGDPNAHHFVVNNVFAGDMCRPSDPHCDGWEWDQFPADEYYPVHRNVKLEGRNDKSIEDLYVFKNNIIQGTIGGDGGEVFSTQNMFIASDYDMSLIFSDFAGNKFLPVASSAMVNAGITSDQEVSAALAKYAKDLAGNPRIVGSSVDLGCYEVQ